MTREDLLNGLADIQLKCLEAQDDLKRKFLDSINPIKVGDIIEDWYKRIKVEKIEYILSEYDSNLTLKYKGLRLTKKGKVSKSLQYDNAIFLEAVLAINGKRYKHK